MIRNISFFALLAWLALAAPALAEEVQVFKPMEEDISPMALRDQAMADAFAEVVLGASLKQLPVHLTDERKELLRQYFVDHAAPYVTGYKIISSEITEAGLLLKLDVSVNYRALRDQLRAMGLTSAESLDVSVGYPEDTPPESVSELNNLARLNGFTVVGDGLPRFQLEPGPKNKVKARLVFPDREWVAIENDLPSLWFSLWGRHFARDNQQAALSGSTVLAVSGWFTPDGAYEFGRVLEDWDRAVQEVTLLEMDVRSSSVSARWAVRVANQGALRRNLEAYLPQRGLTYAFVEEGAQ